MTRSTRTSRTSTTGWSKTKMPCIKSTLAQSFASGFKTQLTTTSTTVTWRWTGTPQTTRSRLTWGNGRRTSERRIARSAISTAFRLMPSWTGSAGTSQCRAKARSTGMNHRTPESRRPTTGRCPVSLRQRLSRRAKRSRTTKKEKRCRLTRPATEGLWRQKVGWHGLMAQWKAALSGQSKPGKTCGRSQKPRVSFKSANINWPASSRPVITPLTR